jgi:hypothetical protein
MCEPIPRQLIEDPSNGIQLADYFKESDPDTRLRFVAALVNGLGDGSRGRPTMSSQDVGVR